MLGAVIGASSLLGDPTPQSLLQNILTALIAGGLTFWLTKHVLSPLQQATNFIHALPSFQGMPLIPHHAAVEFCTLADALNVAADKLRTQDIALNHALNELQEQQYAFDQHAIVSIVDFHGHLQFVNDLLCEMTGYVRHELLGRPFTILSPEEDPIERHEVLWKKLLQGEIWRGEMQIKPKQGRTRWLETSMVPIRDIRGQPQCCSLKEI